MPELQEFKCPACGGAMEFVTKTQRLQCPFCDTEMGIDEYEKLQAQEEPASPPDLPKPQQQASWEQQQTEDWDQQETSHLKIYSCHSCGGEIIADETTGASSCPFCGNPVVMTGQFSGDLKPNYVIPFQKDKKDAKEQYMKYLEGKSFLPKIFKDQNHIDEIKGVYVPFWLYDAHVHADMAFLGTNVRTWTDGKNDYTETSEYSVQREGVIRFENVPEDGSKEMDDNMMESIEPFDFSKAVPFKTAYLAGYYANRYDVDAQSRMDRAKERVTKSTISEFSKTANHYTTVSTQRSQVDFTKATYKYVLYPVWLLNTTYKGEHYHFAMNGQTGKFVGNLPVDNGAYWRFILIGAVIVTVIMFVLQCLILV